MTASGVDLGAAAEPAVEPALEAESAEAPVAEETAAPAVEEAAAEDAPAQDDAKV